MSEAADASNANQADAQRWLTQAVSDLDAARWSGQGRYWSHACFLCQQAAEKALKAVLVYVGEREFRTHSTARLVKRVAAYYPSFEQLAADAPLLDRHYVETRYPNGVGTPDELWLEADFRQADTAAARFVELARHALSQPNTES